MQPGTREYYELLIRICERHRDRVRGRSKQAEEETIAQLRAQLSRRQEEQKADGNK